jgi:hypothetical protein
MQLEKELAETLKKQSKGPQEVRYFAAPIDAMRAVWLPVMANMATRWQRMEMTRNWVRWFRAGAVLVDQQIAELADATAAVGPEVDE